MKKINKIMLKSTELLLLFSIITSVFSSKRRSNGRKKLYLEDDILILTYNVADFTFGHLFSNTFRKIRFNLLGTIDLIEKGNYDICLLQESNWSNLANYFINSSKKIANYFSNNSYVYGSNSNFLNCFNSGNMTLTKYESVNKCLKIPINGKGFINNYFYVHKLLIETRIKIQHAEKELVIYNIHLAPYLKNFMVRKEQIKYILELAKKEYESGNYVVIGGDWNLNVGLDKAINEQLEDIFGNNLWLFEPKKGATHQKRGKDHHKITKIIDGFLFSPNLKGNISTFENFDYSDHSPIQIKLTIKS